MANHGGGISRGVGLRAWRWIAAASLALAIPLAGGGRAVAVDGLVYNPGNGHFYKWVPGSGTWPTAMSGAQALGGYLATVTTAQEKDWIVQNMGLGAASAWLGGSDAASEGTWLWLNGETWSYTNWNVGEPNNSGGEHCLMMYANGTWNDAPSTYQLPPNPGGGYIVGWDSDPNPPPPPVIPADPTNLDATLTPGGTALLTWVDNSTNENLFRIERKIGDGPFESLTTVVTNTTQHEDDTLVPSTLYTYRVRAENAVGPSEWTNEDSVTSGAFAPAPLAPSDFIVTFVNARSADLSWTDNSAGEVSFEIRRKVGDGEFAFLATRPQDATTFHDPGLRPDETYAWSIRAIGTQRASGAIETATHTPETLDVTPTRGDVKNGTKFGKDVFKFTAEFAPNDGAAESAPDPVLEGITVRCGSEAAPVSLKIFPADEGWKARRTKWLWKSPRGSLTRLKVTWDTVKGTVVVVAMGLEMTSAPENPIRVSIVIGDEGGTDVREWTPGRKPGQFKLR